MKVIAGPEQFFIKKHLAEAKEEISKENVYFFDSNTNISEIIDQVGQRQIFQEKRLFVFDNLSVFKEKSEYDSKKDIYDQLIEILKESEASGDESVFLLQEEKSLQNNFKTYVYSVAKFLDAKKLDVKNVANFIQNYIESKGGSIEREALYEYVKLANTDALLLANDLDKLLLNQRVITLELLRSHETYFREENLFAFSNSLETLNFKNIWTSYKKMTKQQVEARVLFGQICNLFTLASVVKNYSKTGMNIKQIAVVLKTHEFRVRKAADLERKIGEKRLKKILLDLNEIDKQMKWEGQDIEELTEQFIIKEFA
ncbi:DNA polymerase III subunit delta [Mycoplasma sp. Ms02]|uniref:DNA polymerase III subunit delta n=1 Tax=Mycoplasma sp. Ms02 TaxID=353851 RepID=UPI001C8AE1E2|nr:hypothetical protein [Mycoplasma sp. Ms02]QZE12606.1 hypothetical protein K4L35_01310 [Mycoplasma sp. Ms02]